MNSQPEVVIEYPGLKILKPPAYKKFRDGDIIAILVRTTWRTYRLGSIYGFYVVNGDDVEAGVARAKANGHSLFWANAEAVVISNPPPPQKVAWGFEFGDTIPAFGKSFVINKAPNDNVSLDLIEF